jgi:hypothetical protein
VVEKRDILAHETIHNNFYQLGMNCDSDSAAMSLSAHFLSAKAFLSTVGPAKVEATADEPFRGNSSQVPLHEAFTPKTGFSQSSLIKANQGKSR